MKPCALLALAGRKSPMSTELFVQAESDLDEAFVELWRQGAIIGYARLVRVRAADEIRAGRPVATFELAELLSPHSPCPGQPVSLSAVLWSRRELHEELSESRSSALREGSMPGLLPRSTDVGCPHGA